MSLKPLTSHKEIKKLKLSTRNKVRTIVYSKEDDSIKLLNKLRKSSSIGELAQIEKTIKVLSKGDCLLPECFPSKVQTKNNYRRLAVFPLDKQLDNLNYLIIYNRDKLTAFFTDLLELNINIVTFKYEKADIVVKNLIEKYGHSHLILRKATLIKSKIEDERLIPTTINLLNDAGLKNNNHFLSSLVHCYQEEQDFLSIKRSILGTRDLGDWNKFTRDMLRIPFHPHAKDNEDFSELIQSHLQSSLIDAVVTAKINKNLINLKNHQALNEMFKVVNASSPCIDKVASGYLKYEDPEDLFYQQSSAWFENDDLINYRLIQDHFFDTPDASYFEINDILLSRIKPLVATSEINQLSDSSVRLTSHNFKNLKKIEQTGSITRSSIFNYIVHCNQGRTTISEESLVHLMDLTRGLSKTINTTFIKTLVINLDSDISKIVLYLLIARKSKNELNGHKLRKLLQSNIQQNYNGKLVNFISDISHISPSIAKFIYEVCIEDFISRMTHIIKSSLDITLTRASLHRWMGEFTGDMGYIERERNLIIDHQINQIRDELDDHRIYADTTRFTEWMEDEISQELNTLLLILDHNNELESFSEPQLLTIIDKCFYEFCSNKFFGIASYLGRRIRHGTFKGHLYSDVISIESRHHHLLQEPAVSLKWKQWKFEHEKRIDKIVQEKLHIETSQKRHGFLNPHIRINSKQEIAKACAKNILQDFNKQKHIDNSLQLIAEYCWRIAEIDLKNVSSYIKNQKQELLNPNILADIRDISNQQLKEQAKDFSRELQSTISTKITVMNSWFQRPRNISPKASLNLLYRAVIAEVNQTFTDFNPPIEACEDDIEIMGGAYHIIYDAFYVIVYNAAKHGKKNGKVSLKFKIIRNTITQAIELSITSEIKETESYEFVQERLKVSSMDDVDGAQLSEMRSGIRKLYHLNEYNKDFNLLHIGNNEKQVKVVFSYQVGHS